MHSGGMMMAARDASEPPPLPDAPTGLDLTAESSTVISASWTDNASSESGYELDIATDSGFNTVVNSAEIAADSTSHSFSDLNPNTTYWVRVRATNATGNSAYDTDSVQTLGASGDAPSTVSALMVSPSSLQGWWHDESSEEVGYEWQVRTATGGGGTVEDSGVQPANSETVTATGLTPTTGSYFFRVRTRFSTAPAVTSEWLEVEVDMHNASNPPDADPDNNALATTSDTELQQTWDRNATDNVRHEVQLAKDSSFTEDVLTEERGPTIESHNWTGLDANTEYFSRVRGVKDSPGAWASTASATTDPDTVPNAPSNHQVTDQQTTQLTHTWDDPATTDTVDIEVAEDAGFSVGLQQDHGVASGTETKTWTSLTEGTEYWAQVRATNEAGDGAWSMVVTGTQLAAPSSLSAEDRGDIWRLSWTNNSSAQDDVEVHRDSGSGYSLFATLDGATSEYDVAKNTGFKYKVRAVSDNSRLPDSDFSNEYTDDS